MISEKEKEDKKKQEANIQEREEGEWKKKGRRGRMWKIILTVCIIVVIIAVVLIPYLKQPKITEETKKNFSVEKFYGESASGERAKIIPENEEALEERIRMISQAKEEIILSTYDIKADISGKAGACCIIGCGRSRSESIHRNGWGSLCDFHLGKSLFSCTCRTGKM